MACAARVGRASTYSTSVLAADDANAQRRVRAAVEASAGAALFSRSDAANRSTPHTSNETHARP